MSLLSSVHTHHHTNQKSKLRLSPSKIMSNTKDWQTMWANAKVHCGASAVRSTNRKVHELHDDCQMIVEQLNLGAIDINFEYLWEKHY
jgi:hypothetical protein